jgi:hypothetical protein
MSKKRIVGIDPGSSMCGVVILDDNAITGAFNWSIPVLWSKISNFLVHSNLTVVIEDIRPYSLKLTPQVIDTCKLIGEMVFRLRIVAGIDVVLIPRGDVKKWVFDTFGDVAIAAIKKKVDKKMFLSCDVVSKEIVWVDTNGRKRRKENFTQVDDRVVTEAMKFLYKIPPPKPGDGYKFGLKDHSWQALALANLYKSRCD